MYLSFDIDSALMRDRLFLGQAGRSRADSSQGGPESLVDAGIASGSDRRHGGLRSVAAGHDISGTSAVSDGRPAHDGRSWGTMRQRNSRIGGRLEHLTGSRPWRGPVFISRDRSATWKSAWASMEAQAAGLPGVLADAAGQGMSVWVDLACLPAGSMEDPGEYHIGRVIDRRASDGASMLFALPAAFDLNVCYKTMLQRGELGTGCASTPASRSITIPSIPHTRCLSIPFLPARSCRRSRSGASHRGMPDSS